MSSAFTCPHCQTPLGVGPGGPPPGSVCPRCNRPLQAVAVAPGAPPPPAVMPGAPRYADDRWEQPAALPAEAPPIPGSVKAAGIIWIVFGGLILLNGTAMTLIQVGNAPPGGQAVAISSSFCGGLLVALFGGAFVFVGVQSVGGTAKDTLGNGIGSIIFGVLIGGFTALLLVALLGIRAAGAGAGPAWVVMIGVIINFLSAAALLAAGIMALVGREGYRAHRRYLRAMAAPRGRR